MPLVRNVMTGANILASGKVARRFKITASPGSTSVPARALLQTNTLPACVWYVFLDAAGPANVSFTPQFAVDNEAGVGPAGIIPKLFPITGPQIIVPGVPLLFTQRIVANVISGIISVPAAAPAAATVDIILAASL